MAEGNKCSGRRACGPYQEKDAKRRNVFGNGTPYGKSKDIFRITLFNSILSVCRCQFNHVILGSGAFGATQ